MGGFMGILMLFAQLIAMAAGQAAPPATPAPVNSADVFQLPMASWQPHCLGFGSQWRYCSGTALRSCANGAVWLPPRPGCSGFPAFPYKFINPTTFVRAHTAT